MKKTVWITLVLSVIAGNSLFAATPRDTLVMASKLDDVITLDPAEIFEFTGAELAANMYDRLIGYDVEDVSKIYRRCCGKLGYFRRRQNLFLQDLGQDEICVRQQTDRG